MTDVPPRTLKRSMRVIGVLLLTLSAVTPASSVFVIVPGVFQQAGTGAFLSMVLAAVVSLAVAYVYAELSSAFPIAGGEYCMSGRTLGPTIGFAMLALTALGNMLGPAVLSLGAAVYLSALVPNLEPRTVGIAIIAATTLLGILHVRTNAWVTGIFLFLEMLALLVLVVLGFSHVHTSLLTLTLHPQALSGNTLGTSTLAMIGLSAAVSILAYNGYGSAVYFSEEMHEAPRLVARTILWALVISVATELIPVTAVLMGAPDLKTFLKSENPFSYFVMATGGSFLNVAVSLGIALAIINAVLVTIMQNGRFLFSTGRDRAWHGSINGAFMLTHSRFHSPWVGTLVSGASAIAACFLQLKLLLVLGGTGIVLTYFTLCFGVLTGRLTGASRHAPYRMPLFPFVPLFGAVALAFVLYVSWLDPDTGRPSLIANAVVIAVAIAYYRLVLLRRGGWVLRGPDDDEAMAGGTSPDPDSFQCDSPRAVL